MNKTCITCKETKDINEFHKKHWGHRTVCKKCRSIKNCTPENRAKRRLKNAQKKEDPTYKIKKREQTRKHKQKPEAKAKRRARNKFKRDNDHMFRLKWNIKSSISESLKGNKNGRHWEDIVRYTLQELKEHLERLFTNGMTWKNYGLWHIDHIIPVSFFKFDSPDDVEFKMCWRLENLQPLWAHDNLVKGANLAFEPIDLGGRQFE